MDEELAREILNFAKENTDSPYRFISYVLERVNETLLGTQDKGISFLKDEFLKGIANWHENNLGKE